MILKKEQKDLFELDNSYWFCQCISADFKMGAGISVQFNQKFHQKKRLETYLGSDFLKTWKSQQWIGTAIADTELHVINLVTKTYYYHKPTYESLEKALRDMKKLIILHNINKIAMPRIGCGLDKLDWKQVELIIIKVFADIDDLEIVVRSI